MDPIPAKDSIRSYYRKQKLKAIEYKGGRCSVCGYDRCVAALEFHHKDPTQKDFQISGGSRSFQRMKLELDKCILMCANCHRELHEGLISAN